MGCTGTITVDITRGGDYALAHYRRLARRPRDGRLYVSFSAKVEAFDMPVEELVEKFRSFAEGMAKAQREDE